MIEWTKITYTCFSPFRHGSGKIFIFLYQLYQPAHRLHWKRLIPNGSLSEPPAKPVNMPNKEVIPHCVNLNEFSPKSWDISLKRTGIHFTGMVTTKVWVSAARVSNITCRVTRSSWKLMNIPSWVDLKLTYFYINFHLIFLYSFSKPFGRIFHLEVKKNLKFE